MVSRCYITRVSHKANRNLFPHQKRWAQNNQLAKNMKGKARFYKGKTHLGGQVMVNSLCEDSRATEHVAHK